LENPDLSTLPTASDESNASANLDLVNNNFYTKAYEQNQQIYLTQMVFKIVDASNNPIPGILVTLYSSPLQTLTDDNGYAIFKDIEAGEHRVEVAYLGKKVSKQVVISEPAVKNQEIAMQPIEIKVTDSGWPWWLYVIFGFSLAIFLYFGLRYCFWRRQLKIRWLFRKLKKRNAKN
jgi:hypothetical protein